MAIVRWTGNARAVAQINRLVPANVAVGNTFTCTINGKALTFTATEATVANVCGGLKALIDAEPSPEFKEVSTTNASTALFLTARTPGKPFTQTSTAAGGTATLTTSTTTANSGPNDWNTAANWSGAAVPTTDDVYIEYGPDILYGLDQSAVAHAGLTVFASYTGRIGLPLWNPAGYREYRGTYLQTGTAQILVGYGDGPGSDHIRIDSGSTSVNIVVYRTAATPHEAGAEACRWKGTGTNTLAAHAGSVGAGTEAGVDTTLASLWIGGPTANTGIPSRGGVASDLNVACGAGAVVTTLRQAAGTLIFHGTVTTYIQAGGRSYLNTVNITTLRLYGGEALYQGTGTITSAYLHKGARLVCARDLRTRTLTNTYLVKNPGDDVTGQIIDPLQTITYTNGPTRTYGSAPAQIGGPG